MQAPDKDEESGTHPVERAGDGLFGGAVTRRGFVASASAVAIGLAIDACGGSSTKASSSSKVVASGTPKRGGTLTVAASGGGPTDTLNPLATFTTPSIMGVLQLYDPLYRILADGSVAPWLVDELEPNKNGTQWTVRLRSGVRFHDGRPLTSADLIASMHLWAKSPVAGSEVAPVDVAKATALDSLTVRVPTHYPLFGLPDILANSEFLVLPADFNPKSPPVGTGPFKYVSFTPGRQMSFARNPDYWQSGFPYLDAIVINDFATETAQVSALLSGQANAANSFSLASVKALQASGVKILSGNHTGEANVFVMNCADAPFTDVRVRQAMKLIVDRPQMLSAVFGPYGAIANDSFCAPFDPLYVPAPQRVQDLEQAKSLLAQAGRSDLTVKLTGAPIAQGTAQMATVFAQQAKGAGVNVVLDQVPADVLFGPNYLKWPFTEDYYSYLTYLATVSSTMLPNASFPETHFTDARFTSLYYQAMAAADLSLRREIAGEMQQIERDQGGYIVPLWAPVLDGHAASVNGLTAGVSGLPFNQFDFTSAWIE
jgi:peptide/nickel transport system substrate-binding protein